MPSSIVLNGTTGIANATWTNSTRPASPVAGQTGYNTDIGAMETYTGSTWSTSDLPAPSTAGNVLTSNGTSWTSSTPNAGFSGATTVSSGTSITLTNTSTQVQAITMTTTGLSVTLPDATTLTAGGIVFCLVNNGQYAYDVKTADGAVIASVEYATTVSLLLTNKSTVAGTWTTVTKPFTLSVAATSYTSQNPTLFCGGALLSSTLVVLSYTQGDYPFVMAGTISGTTVTWGTPVQIYSASTLNGNAAITRTSATTASVLFVASSGTSYIVGVSVSGTTVTYGSASTLESAANWNYNVTDNVSVVSYRNTAGNDVWRVVTNSGTTLTLGSTTTYANNNSSSYIITVDSSRFLTNDPGGSGVTMFSVSGTTITKGTVSVPTSPYGGFSIPASNLAYIGSYKYSYNASGTTINSATSCNPVPGINQGQYVLINGKYVGYNASAYLGTMLADATSNSTFSDSSLSMPTTFYGTQPIWQLDSTTALTFGRSAGSTGYIGVKFIKAS